MASAFTHAFFATALGTVMVPTRAKLVAIGALLSVLPDADVVGFAFGIPYADMLGHRGLSHSLAFAATLAALVAWASRRETDRKPVNLATETSLARVFTYLFLAIASHGALDALTNGGLGVAFFAPFSNERWFFPWRPIVVSPIAVRSFFSRRAIGILMSEFLIVWIPSIALALAAFAFRRSRRTGSY